MVVRVEERMEDSEKRKGASRQVFNDFALEGLFLSPFLGPQDDEQHTEERRMGHRTGRWCI